MVIKFAKRPKNDHNCECSVCAERYEALRQISSATVRPDQTAQTGISMLQRLQAVARKTLVF